MKEQSLVVDRVRDSVGGTATIFQKTNDRGDMLRVCTNVEKPDGTRAIGTYIPACEPIRDASDEIIGVLYVGVPQEAVHSLREQIMDIQVGQTGYVYVLDTEGHYVISKNGERDGENTWEAEDADGRLFIQNIVAKAKTLSPGESADETYPWKNVGESSARVKVARIMYFKPWDWVIGAGSYVDEFCAAEGSVAASEELSAQADGLHQMVQELVSLVQGGKASPMSVVSLETGMSTGPVGDPGRKPMVGPEPGLEQFMAGGVAGPRRAQFNVPPSPDRDRALIPTDDDKELEDF
jgi:cache 3/cache 2 fusion protein